MRVLQFYRTYFPDTQGGLEEAIRQICLSTSALGVEHRVLTHTRNPDGRTLERPEARVIQVPQQWEPASCSMGVGMFRAYREQAAWADLVHIHYPWPFADLVHLVSSVDKPVVVTYHSDIVRQKGLQKLYSPLRSCFFRQVRRVVATSPDYADSSDFLAGVQDRVSVVPLGIAPDSYPEPSLDSIECARRRYGSNFFLFVGVLRYYKGLTTLVEAAVRNGLPVVIAGAGPEEAQLKALAQGADNVQFAGYVSDDEKQALMRACRAVAFPSCERSEAFGVTLLEGQLHGKPLITCDIGTGTSYVNQHGETGLVVPPKDVQAFSLAMQRIAQDDALAARFGQAGRARFDRLFTGHSVGERYYDIYRDLLR